MAQPTPESTLIEAPAEPAPSRIFDPAVLEAERLRLAAAAAAQPERVRLHFGVPLMTILGGLALQVSGIFLASAGMQPGTDNSIASVGLGAFIGGAAISIGSVLWLLQRFGTAQAGVDWFF